MTEDAHDPGWFPTIAPDPPKHISTATIVLGTIVPVAAVAILVLALFTHKSHSGEGRSLPAFQSCLKGQGVLTASAESNDALLRQAAVACKAHVPLLDKGLDPVTAAQKQLDACMQAASQKLRTGAVRIGPIFVPPSRQAFEDAQATCRAESMVSGGSDTTPGVAPSSGGSVA
jgi:hypothetical protein